MANLHVLPNETQGDRPYDFIESVVTATCLRGQDLGRLVINACIEAAWSKDAHKIMFLTGQTACEKGFYEKLGCNSAEKWAMTLRRAPVQKP